MQLTAIYVQDGPWIVAWLAEITPIPRHREIADLLARKICRDLELPER